MLIRKELECKRCGKLFYFIGESWQYLYLVLGCPHCFYEGFYVDLDQVKKNKKRKLRGRKKSVMDSSKKKKEVKL